MSAFDQHDQHRNNLLQELGIGPVWQLRHHASTPAEVPDPVVARVPVEAGELKSPPSLTPELAAQSSRPQVMPPEEVIPQQHAAQAEARPVTETVAEADADTDTSLVAAMSWEVLQPVVESCRACGLCKGRSKSVFGTGDRRATWLFVGEGPGYNENLQGLPFVGAAGQLLDNMLKALGLARGDQTYIANIVKCRPTDENGKDRPPTADEIAACLPYLHRQIALIQPQVIVALGKTAAVSLLGMNLETPVGQLRGKLHHFNNIPLVVTYHPAYLLRKPADKSKTWVDLCMAMQAMPAA
ncbi:uracil-DNA glycosylase family protein [Undibacterium sp. Di26W]|uniref:uracil-DNA glycosylase n=1 Tax=Undibacterium sp. Di26W TaxID=3413035 RepID=UPI003BF43666